MATVGVVEEVARAVAADRTSRSRGCASAAHAIGRRAGRFGFGTYLAEHALKVDQHAAEARSPLHLPLSSRALPLQLPCSPSGARVLTPPPASTLEQDADWRAGARSKKHAERAALHQRLYPTAELHPGRAHYALVCRAVLGDLALSPRPCPGPPKGKRALLAGGGPAG